VLATDATWSGTINTGLVTKGGRVSESCSVARSPDDRPSRNVDDQVCRNSAIARAMGASTSAMSHRHRTRREGAATHRTGWVSKGGDLSGCTGLRPVPSLMLGKDLNEKRNHP
jgi:hypothetical protein